MNSRVLTLHLIEGSADGLQTAEIDTWNGKIFVAPRPELPNLLSQPELRGGGLGVYILIGDDPNLLGHKIIYVGEGIVGNRLKLHSSSNDKVFWDSKTVVIVGQGLDNSACLYLESRLIELATKARVAEVTNGRKPALPFMTDPGKTRAENFLSQVQIILPVLNIDYFVQPLSVTPGPGSISAPATKQNTSAPPTSPRFVFTPNGLIAEAELIQNKFVVIKGSLVNPNETPTIGRSNSTLRSQLRTSGKLVDDAQSGRWVFAEDVPFSSPSAAAAVICGATIAGPAAWKVKGTQQTYGAWLQAQVNAVSAASTTP